MKRLHLLALFVFVLLAGLVTALLAQQAPQPQQTQAQKPFVPVQDELLWKPNPADWLSWRRTLDGQGFSPLSEINRNNVKQLRLMWTRPITGNQNESTPLVYNGVMYVPNSGDIIQAYDGSGGWKINPLQGRKDAERMSADESRQLADASTVTGPLLQASKDGSKVSYLGREDFDGTSAYKLKVTQKDGDEFVYWLDPDTFLEIKIDETRRIRGAQVITETELGDYEKVAGVYFPMSIESWTQGQPNQRARTQIEKAAANPSIGNDLFDEPGAAPSQPKKGR